MRRRVMNKITVVFTVIALACALIPTVSNAGTFTKAQIEQLVRDGERLLLEEKDPNPKQLKMIAELRAQASSDDSLRQLIYDSVKKETFALIEGQKINRDLIKRSLERVPQLLPGISREEFHNLMWEKVNITMKETLTLRIATLAPEGTAWLEVPRTILNKHLKKVSNGKIRIKMYTGGVMGEDADILRKIDMGQLDGCGCTALGVFRAANELGIFSLPMLFRNYKEVDYIMGKFRGEFDESLKKKGYVLASLIDTGFFHLWTKNPVSSLADIRKQRLMTWFGPVEIETMKQLGISPIPVSVPETVTSLNTDLVNANFAPGPWILGTQAYTNFKTYITQPFFYSPAAIIFSAKIADGFRDRYSDNLIHNMQELLIYETMVHERPWIDKHLRPYEEKSMKAFRDYGIKPVTLSATDMAAIEAAAKKVWYALADKIYPRDLLDRVLKELEKYRSGKAK